VLEIVELVSVELELGLLAFVVSASPPVEVVAPGVVEVSVAIELLELGLVLDELGLEDAELLLELGKVELLA